MNIFQVNSSPIIAARELPLKLVIKMPTESAQILLTAFTEERLKQSDVPLTSTGKHYKHFNPKHGSSVWARESFANYIWVCLHGLELCHMYENLYKRTHGAREILLWIMQNIDIARVPSGKPTPIYQAMPEQYQNEDSVKAYQDYLNAEKRHYAKWSSLEHIPSWWNDKSEKYVDKSFKDGIYIHRK